MYLNRVYFSPDFWHPLWNPALTTPPNPFSPQNFRNLPPKSILKEPIKSPDAIQFAFTDEELHIKPGVS